MDKLPLSCLEHPIEDGILKEIARKAKDWSLIHGGAMMSKTQPDALELLPVTLLPSPVPREAYRGAAEAQTLVNALLHSAAHDHDFLASSLAKVIESDDFTKRLFDIYQSVRKEGFAQAFSLGLLRNDLMYEEAGGGVGGGGVGCGGGGGGRMKQVEVNVIAAGFGFIGEHTARVHRYVLSELGRCDLLQKLPENKALEGICSAIVEAWRIFGDESAVVLFVVEDVTYNICDQRMMEYEIRRLEPKARVSRRTLTQLARGSELSRGGRHLILESGEKVAVAYFRVGYDPNQYPSDAEWEARLRIERSTAIKCPSIQYHLVGTKKIQEVLCRKGMVEKFLKDPRDAERVRALFTDLYPLDFDEEGEEGFRLGLRDPEAFVLKPQREGGGNNVYGAEVRSALESLGDERPGWILMRRLRPRESWNYVLRRGGGGGEGRPELERVVSELGMFGAVLGDKDGIVLNSFCGHTLRSKSPASDEGGVYAGFAALDSPLLA